MSALHWFVVACAAFVVLVAACAWWFDRLDPFDVL